LESASNSLGSLKNGDGVQLAVRRFETVNRPVTMDAPKEPLWTQDQAIAYEAALEAINDVIAGYSEQIALEQDRQKPDAARISWLEMRTDHASATSHALTVTDDENVRQALLEYSAMVRAREAPR